jgi:outer membrane protein
MEADQQAFQASEKRFEQGVVNVIDFYIAKNRLANSGSQVLKARLEWEIKKKALDFYMGNRFWESPL